MNIYFLSKRINYATYAYYSSSFTRENFIKLLKPSFYLNFPFFYAAFWLLLEGILENQLVENTVVEVAGTLMSYLIFLGIGLSLWFIPKNHIKLYKDIFTLANLGDFLPSYLHFNMRKSFKINIKYIFAQFFYVFTSASILLFLLLISFFIFFIVVSIIAIVAAITSNINFIVLGIIAFFLIYVAFYAMSFGLPCFFPIILAFHDSWKNQNFITKTIKLGMIYLKYVTLLFSLETLVKAFSIILFIVFISNIENISLNFKDKYIFDTLPNLIETSLLQEKMKIFLVFLFWGGFNIIWDIFKACFISYLFVHHYKIKSLSEPDII